MPRERCPVSDAPGPPRAAFFFDRDGTLIRELEDTLARAEQVELLSGASAAIARANAAGFAALVATNQSAIARGWITHADLEDVHRELQARMAAEGARIDEILSC